MPAWRVFSMGAAIRRPRWRVHRLRTASGHPPGATPPAVAAARGHFVGTAATLRPVAGARNPARGSAVALAPATSRHAPAHGFSDGAANDVGDQRGHEDDEPDKEAHAVH